MDKENGLVPSKTWCRSVEPITKVGYMDGSVDGQAASFQFSFDIGYNQGLKFGIHLGFKEAFQRECDKQNSIDGTFSDPRRINCQLCVNSTMIQEKIDNLYNFQEEKNDEFLSPCNS